MKMHTIDGRSYRLPSMLNEFQQGLYVHLIDWKWAHVTEEPGSNHGVLYDAILPQSRAEQMPMLYPAAKTALQAHMQRFPFHLHKFFNHMASSQAANLNLFLPVLLHPQAAAVLSAIRPDFARLATEQLDHGFRIEFWDEPYGNLGDKTHLSGTDADIAIAYYNQQGELCLWLIEHKLTECEFTTCGGYYSPGKKPQHNCKHSFAEILGNKDTCYYHSQKHFAYWKITERNQDFFPNHGDYKTCPFQGGLNQLWRNQLLALSIEQDERQPYKHVSFSVVRHPCNTALDTSLDSYKHLIANNPKFSTFTSADVIAAAAQCQDPALDEWINWYRGLYDL